MPENRPAPRPPRPPHPGPFPRPSLLAARGSPDIPALPGDVQRVGQRLRAASGAGAPFLDSVLEGRERPSPTPSMHDEGDQETTPPSPKFMHGFQMLPTPPETQPEASTSTRPEPTTAKRPTDGPTHKGRLINRRLSIGALGILNDARQDDERNTRTETSIAASATVEARLKRHRERQRLEAAAKLRARGGGRIGPHVPGGQGPAGPSGHGRASLRVPVLTTRVSGPSDGLADDGLTEAQATFLGQGALDDHRRAAEGGWIEVPWLVRVMWSDVATAVVALSGLFLLLLDNILVLSGPHSAAVVAAVLVAISVLVAAQNIAHGWCERNFFVSFGFPLWYLPLTDALGMAAVTLACVAEGITINLRPVAEADDDAVLNLSRRRLSVIMWSSSLPWLGMIVACNALHRHVSYRAGKLGRGGLNRTVFFIRRAMYLMSLCACVGGIFVSTMQASSAWWAASTTPLERDNFHMAARLGVARNTDLAVSSDGGLVGTSSAEETFRTMWRELVGEEPVLVGSDAPGPTEVNFAMHVGCSLPLRLESGGDDGSATFVLEVDPYPSQGDWYGWTIHDVTWPSSKDDALDILDIPVAGDSSAVGDVAELVRVTFVSRCVRDNLLVMLWNKFVLGMVILCYIAVSNLGVMTLSISPLLKAVGGMMGVVPYMLDDDGMGRIPAEKLELMSLEDIVKRVSDAARLAVREDRRRQQSRADAREGVLTETARGMLQMYGDAQPGVKFQQRKPAHVTGISARKSLDVGPPVRLAPTPAAIASGQSVVPAGPGRMRTVDEKAAVSPLDADELRLISTSIAANDKKANVKRGRTSASSNDNAMNVRESSHEVVQRTDAVGIVGNRILDDMISEFRARAGSVGPLLSFTSKGNGDDEAGRESEPPSSGGKAQGKFVRTSRRASTVEISENRSLLESGLDPFEGFGTLAFDTTKLTPEEAVIIVVEMFAQLDLLSAPSDAADAGSFEEPNSRVPVDVLENFVVEIQLRYFDANPYHNFLHAVDVTHSLFCHVHLLDVEFFTRYITRATMLSLMVTCICHDVGHRGVSNGYLSRQNDALAVMYNHRNVQENLHSWITFQLLARDDTVLEDDDGVPLPKINVFGLFTEADFAVARSFIIDAILETDMADHFTSIRGLESLYRELLDRSEKSGIMAQSPDEASKENPWDDSEEEEDDGLEGGMRGTTTKGPKTAEILDRVSVSEFVLGIHLVGQGRDARGVAMDPRMDPTNNASMAGLIDPLTAGPGSRRYRPAELDLSLDSNDGLIPSELRRILRCLVHLSDLSHVFHPPSTHVKWSIRVMHEFFGEAIAQREAGLEPPAFMDPLSVYVPQSQVDFLEFVVEPLVTALARILPSIAMLRELLIVNHELWCRVVAIDMSLPEAVRAPFGKKRDGDEAAATEKGGLRAKLAGKSGRMKDVNNAPVTSKIGEPFASSWQARSRPQRKRLNERDSDDRASRPVSSSGAPASVLSKRTQPSTTGPKPRGKSQFSPSSREFSALRKDLMSKSARFANLSVHLERASANPSVKRAFEGSQWEANDDDAARILADLRDALVPEDASHMGGMKLPELPGNPLKRTKDLQSRAREWRAMSMGIMTATAAVRWAEHYSRTSRGSGLVAAPHGLDGATDNRPSSSGQSAGRVESFVGSSHGRSALSSRKMVDRKIQVTDFCRRVAAYSLLPDHRDAVVAQSGRTGGLIPSLDALKVSPQRARAPLPKSRMSMSEERDADRVVPNTLGDLGVTPLGRIMLDPTPVDDTESARLRHAYYGFTANNLVNGRREATARTAWERIVPDPEWIRRFYFESVSSLAGGEASEASEGNPG